MAENVLTRDDTSIAIRDRETGVPSSATVESTQFPWPLLCGGDATRRVQNLIGFILKRQQQELNLDSDREHRVRFFRVADSLKAVADEIREELMPEAVYDSGQLRLGDSSLCAWEQRLEGFRQLPDNWDSYGASRITDEAIEKGKSILAFMAAAGIAEELFVAPSPSGGIQIEWGSPGGEVELEIPPTGVPMTYYSVETTAEGRGRETEETVSQTDGLARLLNTMRLWTK